MIDNSRDFIRKKLTDHTGITGNSQSNQEEIQALDFIFNPSTESLPPRTEAYNKFNHVYQEITQKTIATFKIWSSELSTSKLKIKWNKQLNLLKRNIGTLDFSSYSTEVNEHCQLWHDEIAKDNDDVPSSRIWNEVIDPKRSEIARKLSDSKKESCRNQLKEIFSSQLASLTSRSYDGLIDSFLEGNINSLSEALIQYEKTKAQQEIKAQFPNSSITNNQLEYALDNPNHQVVTRAITLFANEEAKRQLKEPKRLKDALENGFNKINLGTEATPVDLEGACLWVPASVRHEVQKDSTGQTRYSFFVYGGVNLQARTNVIRGGNAALIGNRVGGGNFNRNQILKGYQEHHIASDKNRLTRNHELWKLAGMNVNSRANKIYLPKTVDQHPTRSVHSGRHTNSYSENVEKRMNAIVQQGKAGGWAPAQYREATRTALSQLRQDLRAGEIALNKNHRPWAKK